MEEFPITKKEEFEFSEDIRKEISDTFMKSLHEQKDLVEIDLEMIKDIIPNESTRESFRGLLIFSRAVQSIVSNEKIPEKERALLKIQLMDLNPIGGHEVVSGISSYSAAIKSIVSTLDDIVTKEVSDSIHVYAEKIFLPPVQAYYNEIVS